MSFESEFKSHLQADSGIAAVVNDGIYPGHVPQGAGVPAVTYERDTTAPQNDLAGTDGNLLQIGLEVRAWAESFITAAALGELVRERLKTAASGFHSLTTNIRDEYQPEAKRWVRILTVSCWWRVGA